MYDDFMGDPIKHDKLYIFGVSLYADVNLFIVDFIITSARSMTLSFNT